MQYITIMILGFPSRPSVYLKKQSDECLPCLPFNPTHLLDAFLFGITLG